MSKLGKIFKTLAPISPLANLLAPKKKKTVFVNLAPKTTAPAPAVTPASKKESSERRQRIATRLKSGGRSDADVATFNEDEEDVIKRAAARRAKLLGG